MSPRVSGSLSYRRLASGETAVYAKLRIPGQGQSMRTLGRLWTGRGRPPAGYLSKRTAAVALRELLTDLGREVEQGADATPAAVTLAVVADDWLAAMDGRVTSGELRAQTWTDYTAVIRNHINPALGERDVHEIEPGHVRQFIADRRAAGCKPRSLVRQVTILGAVCEHAVDHPRFRLRSNPVAALKRSDRPRVTFDGSNYVTLSGEQVRQVADAMPTREGREAVLIAFASGARKGELVELRWRDVLWQSRQLHFARALDSRGQVKTPKGKRGRHVPLAPDLAALLDGMSQRGYCAGPDDLILVGETGERLNGFTLLRHFRAAVKAAGLGHLLDGPRPVRWHDLRHSFCSAAIQRADPAKVQAWAGHANLATTQRYLHARSADGDADALGAALALGPDPRAVEPEAVTA